VNINKQAGLSGLLYTGEQSDTWRVLVEKPTEKDHCKDLDEKGD
jgi:hypothetical protein